MKTQQLGNSQVCYDDYNLENKPDLQALLKGSKLTQLIEQIWRDVTLVLWWDGTMLRAIRENYMNDRPFLGINFGTLGFLLNDKSWIQESGDFIERQYPLLEVKKNGKRLWVWCNDVNLYSPGGKLVKLDISLGGKWALELSGDGAIIATPAGSTWHSKSYFGPVIPHINNAFLITPKGNTTPQAPKMISDDETIRVDYTGRKFGLWVNLDWVNVYSSQYDEEVSLEITKLEEKIIFLISKNHEKDWDAKVMEQQWFSL